MELILNFDHMTVVLSFESRAVGLKPASTADFSTGGQDKILVEQLFVPVGCAPLLSM